MNPQRANWGIEPSPRHSQCRVLPLHQTRQRNSFFSRWACPARPTVPRTSGRGGTRTLTATTAATFSKRVRRNRYSPLFLNMPPPGIEPGFRASHARVVSVPPQGLNASARIRTRNTAFEAPHDLRFTTKADQEPVAGVEPATRRYEGRVMPTSPIGPNKKPRGLLPGTRG